MSDLKKKNRVDYSKYDEMGTEALEEILRLDFQMSEEAESDIDAILYISEVIARREKNPPDVEAAWEQFNRKYRPYVTDGRSLYDFDDKDDTPETASGDPATGNNGHSVCVTPPHKYWRGTRRLVRAGVVAAILAAFLFATSVTAYALGYDLWGTFVQWTKDTFSFVSQTSDDNYTDINTVNSPIEQEYASLQEALDAYGITEPLLPTWIPEGFAVKEVTVRKDVKPGCIVFSACYRQSDQSLTIQINMYQNPSSVDYTTWQKDEADVDIVDVNGHTFYIMENIDRWSATWTNGVFEENISGNVSSDELNTIIQSIYRKDD